MKKQTADLASVAEKELTIEQFIERGKTPAYNLKNLKDLIPAGATVYSILRSVSRSGTQRKISFVFFDLERDAIRKQDITFWVAMALGLRFDRDAHAVVINGGGMDFGEDVVQSLGHALFADTYALRQEWL